jgi:Skp family chaperone for outer membrane proteins
MRFFWALVLTFFLTDFIYAQRNVRIGFLNIDKVLTSHQGFSESSQDLETKIMSWRDEIEKRQKELNEQSKALEIERPLLTEEIAEERKDDIAFEQDKLNQYIEQRFGVEGDWIKQKLLLAQPAQDEILTAIREIASDRKLNYVFDSTAEILVLHSEKKYDISDLVIRYLEIDDKKKAQAFLAETKKEERKEGSNPSLDERRKKIEQQNAERRKLNEERKAERKRKKEAKRSGNKTTSEAASGQTQEEIRAAKKAEQERKKQEREAEAARKKKEKEEALAKRKKERLEELERRKKEFEEKRKQAQQKK